jgi:hypothetical protein
MVRGGFQGFVFFSGFWDFTDSEIVWVSKFLGFQRFLGVWGFLGIVLRVWGG